MIQAVLKDRGERYGDFAGHAKITQDIKKVIQLNSSELNDSQTEALEMIAHKMGRILNGDPNYDDSWTDIAGYATLVVKEIREAKPQTKRMSGTEINGVGGVEV